MTHYFFINISDVNRFYNVETSKSHSMLKLVSQHPTCLECSQHVHQRMDSSPQVRAIAIPSSAPPTPKFMYYIKKIIQLNLNHNFITSPKLTFICIIYTC